MTGRCPRNHAGDEAMARTYRGLLTGMDGAAKHLGDDEAARMRGRDGETT
jgi:hypothetical protein